MGVIYKITSPTNRIYVGKTYDLRKRINGHRCDAKKAAKDKENERILYNSVNKYGWDAHKVDIIEEIENCLLNDREIYWIAELKTYYYQNERGMNMTKGGEGQRSSWMHDEKRRKAQSDLYSKEGNPFYGKNHTEETKKILAEKASKRQKERGIKIPEWGVNKGRLKVMKPCVVYNNNGEFVGEYDSLTNCSKFLNIKLSSIKDSVIYGSWIFGKYLIKYKTENYPLKIEVGEIRFKNVKRPVIYIDFKRGRHEYPSALEAAIDLGIPKTTINRAAQYNNGKPIRSGHIFVYKDI
jgi:group I intron endonuclease